MKYLGITPSLKYSLYESQVEGKAVNLKQIAAVSWGYPRKQNNEDDFCSFENEGKRFHVDYHIDCLGTC